MTAYYNEFDPYAAAWLRNLISAGHIAPGDVDERSIVDVRPDDVKGYTQVHFFAGIGGWSLAARLAGWPDDRPLWTGSCPCQPFSAAGKRAGEADARHLWPEMRRLVSACRPPVVAGEQVASKDGRVWLAGVRTDLEDVAYDVWAADTCAAGAGAPHIRQRLYWLADADGGFARHGHVQSSGQYGQQPQDGGVGGLEHATRDGRQQRRTEPSERGAVGGCGDDVERLGDAERQRREVALQQPGDGGEAPSVGQANVAGGPRASNRLGDDDARLAIGSLEDDGRRALRAEGPPAGPPGPFGPWSRYDVVHCTDAKARRFEPGSFPLAHGVSNRVGRLRAYGNAIVPQVAAQVLGAYLDGRGLCMTAVSDVSSDIGVFA